MINLQLQKFDHFVLRVLLLLAVILGIMRSRLARFAFSALAKLAQNFYLFP